MRIFHSVIAISFVIALAPHFTAAQKFGKYDRQRGQEMLRMIKRDIEKHYYDPKFRGIDIDARFAEAHERLKTAESNGQVMGIIAQVLVEFQDSHTRFIPPPRTNRTEYGWKVKVIGDSAFVTAVKPGSDAEKKGLRVGDRITAVDNTIVGRDNLSLMKYLYYALRPQPGMRLAFVRPGTEAEQELIVEAHVASGGRVLNLTGDDIWEYIREIENESHLNRHRYISIGKEVFIWRMPGFDMTERQVDDAMARASKYPAMIFDLRGNGGGSVKMFNRLVGNLFDRDIKVADWVGRKKFDPQIAKTRGGNIYKGEVIVLIDAESASASELFARVMQLEKRGRVLGDRSAGSVMVSRYYSHKVGLDVVSFYGANVTMADLIMADGVSLENTGVTPDQLLLPTGDDLAAGRDPVLARAVEMLGGKLTSEDAGKMFPVEWRR
jgi:carboxyl-terminal processing protease